jgi:undecaprenyl-diphosphatase
LILASIPGAIAGAFGEEVVDKHLGQPWLIGVMLAVFGVLLLVVDRRAKQSREVEDLKASDAVVIGIAQALALSPGVSRSGVTITAARWRGMTRESAVRFSFLMSLPIIGGAGIYKGAKLLKTGLPPHTANAFLVGMAAAAVTGFLAVSATMRLVRKRPLDVFVVYRVAAAIAILAIIASGFRPARG